jgi:opacity protein-like surface antigen
LKNLIVVVLCALLLACLIPAVPSASAADPFFMIGQVKDGNGAPLPDVNVSASNVTTGISFYSSTNSTGGFNISLPGGIYNISASRVNYSSNVTYHEIVVGPSDAIGIDFTLNELLGRVFGFITSGNVSVGGVTITLSNIEGNFTTQSQLPFGQYSIDIVAPGVYVAKAEKAGYVQSNAPYPVIVTRGSNVQLNFSIEMQPARVYGTVKVGNTPEKDVNVVLLLDGVVKRTAKTDSEGNYSFANLEYGEYQLHLFKEGLVESTVPVSLAPLQDKRVDPVMSRSPVEGLKGFIGDLDLTHSLMIVALLVTVIIMAFAIFIRMRSIKKPGMLANEEKEEEEREEKLKKK